MSYHDLSESTLSDDERSAERDRLVGMLLEVEHRMTNVEQSFVSSQRKATWPPSVKQLYWLRDIKDRYQ
jgi:hypothetical protein